MPGHWFKLGICLFAFSLLCFARLRTAWIGLISIILAVTFLGMRHQVLREHNLPDGLITFEGKISAPWINTGEHRSSRILLSQPVCCKGEELRLSLPLKGHQAPDPGTPVRFRTTWIAGESVPRFLGERPVWRARNSSIPRRIFLRSADLMERLGDPKPSIVLRIRCFILKRFQSLNLTGSAADLWGAMALGLPPAKEDVFSPFAESGTIHTLVVSGLQVTLVILLLEALWRRIFRRGSTLVAIMGGITYGVLVGLSAAVWRGLLMGMAWALGRKCGWKVPPVLNLHGTLLVWLIFHPSSGADPGFLLAWFAILSIYWAAEPLAGLWSPLLGGRSLWLARFAAPWLATMPLLALFHGGAPIYGVLANMLVLPIVAVLTPVCLILTLLPIHWAAQFVGFFLNWTGEWLVPRFAAIQPLATGVLFPWFALLAGWLLLAYFQAHFRKTRALTIAITGLSLALLFTRGTGRSPGTFQLEAVDIGQGDALIIRQPGGEATMIDTGPSPWSARRLVRVLSRRGVREKLHLVITHPHSDHAQGFATLARLWRVESLTLPEVARPNVKWSLFISPGQLRDANQARRHDKWIRSESSFEVLWPPKPFELRDANMVSLVLRVRWRDRAIFLMGDALGIQEEDILDLESQNGDFNPASDAGSKHNLLKAGHHGSSSSSSLEWVRHVNPDLVIFTAAKINRFDFPAKATLKRFQDCGVSKMYTVGCSKGVLISASASGWNVDEGIGQS